MQMAQELEVVERSPEFINPYREDAKLVSRRILSSILSDYQYKHCSHTVQENKL